MDVLTKEQLKEIERIIDDHIGIIMKISVGEDRQVNKDLLKKLGIPEDAPDMIQNAFVLGKIIQLLEENDIKKMTFDQLKEKAKEYKLTTVERNSLDYARKNAAKYVTGLGQRIKTDITGKIDEISHDANLEAAERKIIRDTVAQGILKQQSRSRLVSELGHATGDWKRDWKRLAHTELWNSKLLGEAITILQGQSIYGDKGGDTLVYRRPSPDACQHCKRLYLEDDGVTPKVFKLSELLKNGTNVKKKVSEWKPIVGATHPNCTCPIAVLPDGFGFDKNGELVYIGEGK